MKDALVRNIYQFPAFLQYCFKHNKCAMHTLGKIALGCFSVSLAIGIIAIPQTLRYAYTRAEELNQGIPLLSFILTNVFTFAVIISISHILFRSITLQVALRSHLLGSLLAMGIGTIIFGSQAMSSLGWYTCIMSGFHFSEYIITSIIRPQTLSIDSFLLNHSKAYGIAAVASWGEFFLELWLIPGLKDIFFITLAGVIICLAGEVIRKTAMLTAAHNFDHLIRTTREDRHELVTTGIYSIWRHPSYVGWFYWSIGTQIILCNPFCFIAYLIASWKFFSERVYEEELTLLHFFGDEYVDYQTEVPTGLPFIKGFLL